MTAREGNEVFNPSGGRDRALARNTGARVIWGCSKRSRSAGSAFGPDYWLPRCDGFQVVAEDGGHGVVDEIVEARDVLEGLTVRFADRSVYIDVARIVDIDPIARLVVVDRGKIKPSR